MKQNNNLDNIINATKEKKKDYAKLVKQILKSSSQTTTNAEIANILSCSKKRVQKAIKQLVANGEPIATYYGYGGGHKYTKSVMEHQHCIDTSVHITNRLEARNSVLVRNMNKLSSSITNKKS